MRTGPFTDEMLRALAAAPAQRPRASRRLEAGAVLGDRFVIEGLAGWGGMGAIYRATDRQGDAAVAIKVLHATRADADRFAQEARTLAELTHPAIVRYVAQGAGPDGQIFLAMEWLDGEDLSRRLVRGPLGLDESLALASRVASALAAAHGRGIVHRDIKPSNLFLVGGEAARVKVVDFGVARQRAGEGLVTRAGAVLGTVGYMAPEQARGARDVDARADVFAMGCVLFECLAGRPAFSARQPLATLAKVVCAQAPRVALFRSDVPPALDGLVGRMLEKDRDARPADAAAVLAELDQLAGGAPRGEPAKGTVSVILAELAASEVARAREVVRPFGGELDELADGKVVVRLGALAAAACAQTLRESHPGARVALAVGTDDAESTIDRAASLLEAEPDASGDVPLPIVDRDRFRIDGEIARGGMGRILSAEDLRLHRPVALKELLLGWSSDLLRRFEREVRITARLQHPAIVDVHEAGRWPSGEPFFVMDLVSGRSLEAAIAAARTPNERLALLPHALAAVEALAYAHSQRIIHRDLKPANILVGTYGETVVIDWGLAKDLSHERFEDSAPRLMPAPDSDVITVFGDVLGTPAYMPPEQAAGDPVDERSDVYSLGAILYHLLAGAPPHSGASASEMLHRVRSEPPPSLADVAPSTPKDLLALVAKAMDPDPARRYPSAVTLAEDLVRFQTGRLVGAHRYTWWQLARRFVRRNRAAVAVAASLLALVAALSAYGVRRIVAERDVAVEHRQSAERLTTFVLYDLRDKLSKLGKIELIKSVGEEIDRYYRNLAGVMPALEADSLDRWAQALEVLGTMNHARGDDTAALAQYRECVRIRQMLVRVRPRDDDARRALAKVQNGLGILLKNRDRDGAMAAFEAAMAVLDPISEKPETSWQLSSVLLELGEQRYARGQIDAALLLYRRSLALRQAVADSGDDLLGVSKVEIRIGDTLADGGDLAGALDLYREARTIRSKLLEGEPQNTDFLKGLAFVEGKLAECLLQMGSLAEAETEQEAALAHSRRLHEYDPDDVSYLEYVAVDESVLGKIKRLRGDLDGAALHVRTSLEQSRRLAERDPTHEGRQAVLGRVHENLGQLLLARGDSAGALAELRGCEAIFAKLAGKDGGARVNLSRCRQAIGDVLLRSGDAAGALAAYRDAAAQLEAVMRDDPSVTFRVQLPAILGKIADLRRRQADGAAEASALLRRAVDSLRQLETEGRLDADGKATLQLLERR